MTRAWWRAVVAAAAVLVLLAGCSAAGARRAEPSQAADQPASGVDAARGFRSARGYRATPVPTRIQIPSIGVASALNRLGRAPDGTVQTPRCAVRGWPAGTRWAPDPATQGRR